MCEIQCVSVMSRADRGGVSCLSQIVDRDSRDTENRLGDAARRRDDARDGPATALRGDGVEAQAVDGSTRHARGTQPPTWTNGTRREFTAATARSG